MRPPIDSITIGRCPFLTLAIIKGVARTREKEERRARRRAALIRLVTFAFLRKGA